MKGGKAEQLVHYDPLWYEWPEDLVAEWLGFHEDVRYEALRECDCWENEDDLPGWEEFVTFEGRRGPLHYIAWELIERARVWAEIVAREAAEDAAYEANKAAQ